MSLSRRNFLRTSVAAGLGLASNVPASFAGALAQKGRFEYRIAFELWLNDVRDQPLTLSNWPSGVLDDETVEGIVRALDVQSASGYNIVDLAGLWTTYGWPTKLDDVVDTKRRRRIARIIQAAHDRHMKVVCFPSGILNWGYDQIIKSDPALASDNKHEMNPFSDKSWEWLYKVFDYVADNYDVDGFHLEAADQGRCKTARCMAVWPDNVAYYCSVTKKMADYLRRRYPRKLLISTIQNFGPWGTPLSQEQRNHIVNLSESIDCLFDQGHRGTYISRNDWSGFIPSLRCGYGTSGGIWVYPPQRWSRTRWFLPYTQKTGRSIQDLFRAGGRGVMYYQGPVENPGVEANIDFGGRMMNDPNRSTEDVLSETLEHLYRPKTHSAQAKLLDIFKRAESSYFDQWDLQAIAMQTHMPAPGELHLTDLFGASPGPSEYLLEPYLNTNGRLQYKQSLVSLYTDLEAIEGDFDDRTRIARIKQGISAALDDINNIARAKGESAVWDDRQVGRQY